MFCFNALISLLTLVLTSHTVSAQLPQGPSDVQILNYALSLEYLENAFYNEGLSKFDEKSFSTAGLNRSLFEEIAHHESDHVALLSKALGDQATKPCNYSFPYTDVKGFAALGMVLEGLGVSAYLGAAAYITRKDYLLAIGSILATESRHAAYLSSVPTNYQAPWSSAFDTPLDLDQVYSLAAPFITSCPPNNPSLPLKSFPALNVTTTSYTAGSNLSITVPENALSNVKNGTQLYVAFITGLHAIYSPYNANTKSVAVPQGFTHNGTVYAVLTATNSSNGPVPTDDTTLAGPTILLFPNNGTEGDVKDSSATNKKSATNGASQKGVSIGYTAFISLLIAGAISVIF